MTNVLLVALGGAFGCAGRYVLSEWVQRLTAGPFPSGTLAVNVLGSAFYGLVASLLAASVHAREELRLLVMVGFLGGFTTFSAYAFQSVALAEEGLLGKALVNLVLSNSLCLAAALGGWVLGARL